MRAHDFLSKAILGMLLVCAAASAEEKKIPIIDEGGIGKNWGIAAGTALAAPAYPAEYVAKKDEVCMTVGYLLNADGSVSDFGVLNSWSSNEPRRNKTQYWQAFASAASAALAQWHFLPKPGIANPQPVYTAATFLFAPTSVDALKQHCAIASLPHHIAMLRRDRRVLRRMADDDVFSRLELDTTREMRYRNEQASRLEKRDQEFYNNSQRNTGGGQAPQTPQPPSGNK